MKSSIFIVLILFITGLSFHYDQSFFDFGEILLPNQFSIRSHILFLFSIVIFIFFIFNNINSDEEITLFFSFLIFFPSIYVYRFGIFDEVLIFIFCSLYSLRSKKSSFNYFDLFILLFLLFSSFVGLIYTIKSLRYVFQCLSIFLMCYYLYNTNIKFNKAIVNNLIIISVFYFIFVLIGYFITFFNSPFLNLYLYGLGYSPTTFVNVPSLFLVPIFSYLYINGKIPFIKFILPILLALSITILSDSRTGFLPFLASFPFLLSKFNIIKLFYFSLSILVISYLVGLFQFNNPYWLFDTVENLFAIFKIGGSTTIDYYGKVYNSSSGDTGRFTYILSPFLFYLNFPFYILTGVGVYGFYVHGFPFILEISNYLDSSVDLVTSGLVIDGIVSIPRPPTFPSFLLEYGIVVSFILYYKLLKNISFNYNKIFFDIFYLLIFSASFFLEIHESLLFFYLIFHKNIFNLFKY